MTETVTTAPGATVMGEALPFTRTLEDPGGVVGSSVGVGVALGEAPGVAVGPGGAVGRGVAVGVGVAVEPGVGVEAGALDTVTTGLVAITEYELSDMKRNS